MIQTKAPLAILYSDQSVLEYHHCARAFEIAANDDANIFHGLSQEQYREMRKLITSMVLATDMAKHFEYINKFKARYTSLTNVVSGPSGETPISPGPHSPVIQTLVRLEDASDRAMVLELAIKCADLGNPTRPSHISRRWTDAIMEEFFHQGDQGKNVYWKNG